MFIDVHEICNVVHYFSWHLAKLAISYEQGPAMNIHEQSLMNIELNFHGISWLVHEI
jgi:hypothetical protein